jgi:hypothetical protein
MKYKVGDKLRVLNPEKCGLYNDLPGADHIVITGKDNNTYGSGVPHTLYAIATAK